MRDTRYGHLCIELCAECGGSGMIYLYQEMDIMKQREPKLSCCQCCNGTGRVLKREVSFTDIMPFDLGAAERAVLIPKKYDSAKNGEP